MIKFPKVVKIALSVLGNNFHIRWPFHTQTQHYHLLPMTLLTQPLLLSSLSQYRNMLMISNSEKENVYKKWSWWGNTCHCTVYTWYMSKTWANSNIKYCALQNVPTIFGIGVAWIVFYQLLWIRKILRRIESLISPQERFLTAR